MKFVALLFVCGFAIPAWSADVVKVGFHPASGGGSKEQETDPFVRAITSFNWSWEETTTGRKRVEEIQFYQGGLARNPQFFTATWEVTSPHVLVVKNTRPGGRNEGRMAYLVFDAGFTHYIGIDFNGRTNVEGFRREAVDPARKSPAAEDN
jgi:hypothetical protein